METENNERRGYLSKYKNYREWFLSHDIFWQKNHLVKCSHCGKKFVPSSPNQKFCGPENPACHTAKSDKKLSDGGWVRNISAETLTPLINK